MTLAAIAFDLRFGNTTDEEDARLLPFNHQNIPQPVRTETRVARRFGDGAPYREVVETFADGSAFARSEANV